MFDIGFFELVVIGLVALVVLGPERLPKVARTAGALLGRARHYVNEVKSEINREVNLQEFRALHAEVASSAREFQDSMRREMSAIQGTVAEITDVTDIMATPPADTPKPEEAPSEEATPALLPQTEAGHAQEIASLPYTAPPSPAPIALPSSSPFDQTAPVA